MPIHLPPIPRRTFLFQTLLLAAAGCWGPGKASRSRPKSDPDLWALFSDTHIAADPANVTREVRMAGHLEQAAREVLALERPPTAVLVNGDCALLKGESGDYATFSSLLRPLRESGLPLWCSLGNHDHRQNFRTVVAPGQPDRKAPEDRHVAMIPGRRFNAFMIDSLDVTNQTPGSLGQAQLAWLRQALDANADKPAVVIGHHNIELGEAKMGMKDSKELLDMLEARRQVKAYVFGHTHTWKREQTASGLHLINLPPVAYVFDKARPSGWVQARFQNDGVTLELRSMRTDHPEHAQPISLRWRPA